MKKEIKKIKAYTAIELGRIITVDGEEYKVIGNNEVVEVALEKVEK